MSESLGSALAAAPGHAAVAVADLGTGASPSAGATDQPPPGTMPGGGQVGAVLFNRFWITPGSVDTTGS